MKGLIIKEPYIDLILNGKKVWEIRGSNTKIRGKVALIKSGTGYIYGTVEVVDSIGPLKLKEFKHNARKLNYKKEELTSLPYGRRTYAWVLKKPEKFKKLVPYKKKPGAVIWVNLD